jgi:hypothetical protein
MLGNSYSFFKCCSCKLISWLQSPFLFPTLLPCHSKGHIAQCLPICLCYSWLSPHPCGNLIIIVKKEGGNFMWLWYLEWDLWEVIKITWGHEDGALVQGGFGFIRKGKNSTTSFKPGDSTESPPAERTSPDAALQFWTFSLQNHDLNKPCFLTNYPVCGIQL